MFKGRGKSNNGKGVAVAMPDGSARLGWPLLPSGVMMGPSVSALWKMAFSLYIAVLSILYTFMSAPSRPIGSRRV